MARVRLRSGQAYEFACHSKACAPPPAGTGGSNPTGGSGGGAGGSGGSGSGGDRFDEEVEYEQNARKRMKTEVRADLSPHYKKRTAEEVGAMSESDAMALVRDNDATGRRILDKGAAPQDGDVVGVRANLNVKKTTGITVQTMHHGTQDQLDRGTGLFGGEAVGYGAAVTLSNAQFSVNQNARAKIVSKETNKFPMASVDGKLNTVESMSKYGLDKSRFDGVEITFNPMKQHLFVDPDGRAVKSAASVTVVGSKVYARGTIKYWDEAEMPRPARGLPSDAHA